MLLFSGLCNLVVCNIEISHFPVSMLHVRYMYWLGFFNAFSGKKYKSCKNTSAFVRDVDANQVGVLLVNREERKVGSKI